MKTTVYKIFDLDGQNNLCSLIVFGKARKTYRLGVANRAPRWLAEKGYHITAFNSLKNAEHFLLCWRANSRQIWECEATGVFSDMRGRCEQESLSDGKLTRLTYVGWPNGTVMCKTLKLVKEVK